MFALDVIVWNKINQKFKLFSKLLGLSNVTYENPCLTTCYGHQDTFDDNLTALSQLMHICNKKSRNGVYKKNTFSLSCRQDNTAEANVNTNGQSCMKTQGALPQTHTRTEKHIVHPINHPPTKQSSQTQSVFAGATAFTSRGAQVTDLP